MVTLPVSERFAFFKRSVAAFCAQTHRDKELVVVSDGRSEAQRPVAEYVATLGRSDIRFIAVTGTMTLGALRNRAVEAARGAYVCQWDDDDLYHPRRLEEQLRALQANDTRCVYLEDVMQYLEASRTLVWTNWRATDLRVHPGTLLCARDAQPPYPELGEEGAMTHDAVVCRILQERPGFGILAEKAHLYVYVTHGANTYPNEHHAMLAEKLAISRGLLLRREAVLREGLAAFDFGSGDVIVQGSNGPAFTLTATRSS